MQNSHSQLINMIATEPDFKGLGTKRAREVVEAFNDDIYDRLDSCNAQNFIPPLTHELAVSLVCGWKINKNKKELVKFLDELGVEAKIAPAIYERFGTGAVELIKSNPYRLLAVMSWRKVDHIGLGMGLKDHWCRIVGAVEQCMYKEYERDKNTWVKPEDLTIAVSKLLKIRFDSAGDAVRIADESGAIVGCDGGYQIPGVSFFESVIENWVMENVVCNTKLDGQISRTIKQFEKDNEIDLTFEQKSVIYNAMSYGVSICHGGAGVGKTFTLKCVVDCAERILHKKPVLMALAAKACRKMAQATGKKAVTLAKCLYHFTKKDLENAFVIIDEASMVSLSDFFHLIEKLPISASMLLVGDAAQIPSINAGTVLYSLINSNAVPSVELTIAHRQAFETGIPYILGKIRDGIVPDIMQYRHDDAIGVYIIEKQGSYSIEKKVIEVFDFFEGKAQIISPLAVGSIGSASLNNLIHRHVYGKDSWCSGTPVIFTKNLDSEIGGVELVNGLMGHVRHIRPEERKWPNSPYLEIDFEGKIVTLTRNEVERYLEKAYALTVHKAQGSEWKTVIAVITKNNYLVDRSMVYTAISRCRERCVIITSDISDFKWAVGSVPFFKRRRNRLMTKNSRMIPRKHFRQIGLFEET